MLSRTAGVLAPARTGLRHLHVAAPARATNTPFVTARIAYNEAMHASRVKFVKDVKAARLKEESRHPAQPKDTRTLTEKRRAPIELNPSKPEPSQRAVFT